MDVIGPVSTSVSVTAPRLIGSSPSQGVFAISSTTHAPSVWIKEDRVADLAQGFDLA